MHVSLRGCMYGLEDTYENACKTFENACGRGLMHVGPWRMHLRLMRMHMELVSMHVGTVGMHRRGGGGGSLWGCMEGLWRYMWGPMRMPVRPINMPVGPKRIHGGLWECDCTVGMPLGCRCDRPKRMHMAFFCGVLVPVIEWMRACEGAWRAWEDAYMGPGYWSEIRLCYRNFPPH